MTRILDGRSHSVQPVEKWHRLNWARYRFLHNGNIFVHVCIYNYNHSWSSKYVWARKLRRQTIDPTSVLQSISIKSLLVFVSICFVPEFSLNSAWIDIFIAMHHFLNFLYLQWVIPQVLIHTDLSDSYSFHLNVWVLTANWKLVVTVSSLPHKLSSDINLILDFYLFVQFWTYEVSL